jgi:hypothetical protein
MQSILRRLLHQFPLPLGSRTFWPPCRPGHLNRRLLDGLVLLLLFRFDLLDRGVAIVDVTTAGGEVAFLFLFFFFFVAFTAETAATTAEVSCFRTTDLVLRRDFAAPPASGPVPASPSPASSLVSSSASTDESDS